MTLIDRLSEHWRALTSGQRWTCTLLIGLAVSVLSWGFPEPVQRLGAAASPPPAPSTASPSVAAPAATRVAPMAPQAPAPAPAVVTLAEEAVAEAPTGAPARPARVVALVGRDDGPLPGRDDAFVASVFLTSAGIPHTIVTADPNDPDLCAGVLAAGNLVLAGDGLGAGLRDCLIAGGAVLIAPDPLGDLPPAEDGAGHVLSTRRGVTASLADLGRALRATGDLAGKLGIVGSASVRSEVEAAIDQFEDLGLDVVAAAYLPDRAGPGDVSDGVLAFDAKAVERVVFATSVANQVVWAALEAVLRPGVAYVVSDTADSVINESYPPTFDGAVAHTALRVPWFERAHGATPVQQACRQTFDAAADPDVIDTAELARVYAWCQNVELAVAALAPGEASFATALRSASVLSPLTSDLGPLPEGGWGPTEDAVLRWAASCSCWTEARPLQRRVE